jgi:formylglycine-generating enzyme required for sulfatase activity
LNRIMLLFTIVTFWACFCSEGMEERSAGVATGIGMEFVKIPAGSFLMGCSSGNEQCYDRELPAHQVEIKKSFEMSKYEVTQEQWENLMGITKPYRVEVGDERQGIYIVYPMDPHYPVTSVNFFEVLQFVEKLNALKDGYLYRLPTEAEWEYAARGGKAEARYGDLEAIAWFDKNSGNRLHSVGELQPNSYGLYDMLGNTWEWCSDLYAPYGSPPQDSGPTKYNVVRGGSYNFSSRMVRVSSRYKISGGVTSGKRNVGFRCIREAVPD